MQEFKEILKEEIMKAVIGLL